MGDFIIEAESYLRDLEKHKYQEIPADVFLLGPDDEAITVESNWKKYSVEGVEIPVMWSQLKPYNNYCPIVDGNTTPTGCTVTAVAQIMAYYEWPKSHNDMVYDWREMKKEPNALKLKNTSAQDMIAHLMRRIGIAGGANYSPT